MGKPRNQPRNNVLDEMVLMLNSLLPAEDQSCNEACSHGGGCTLSLGHSGPHEARGVNDILHCSWED